MAGDVKRLVMDVLGFTFEERDDLVFVDYDRRRLPTAICRAVEAMGGRATVKQLKEALRGVLGPDTVDRALREALARGALLRGAGGWVAVSPRGCIAVEEDRRP